MTLPEINLILRQQERIQREMAVMLLDCMTAAVPAVWGEKGANGAKQLRGALLSNGEENAPQGDDDWGAAFGLVAKAGAKIQKGP